MEANNSISRLRLIYLWVIIAWFIVLFLCTGLGKLIDHTRFLFKLNQDPFIGSFAGIIAWIIPLWEIATALWLAFAQNKKPGLISTVVLMASFTLYVGLVLVAAKDVPCTCTGMISRMSWPQHLFFNIGMVILALIGLILNRTPAYQRTSTHQLSYLN